MEEASGVGIITCKVEADKEEAEYEVINCSFSFIMTTSSSETDASGKKGRESSFSRGAGGSGNE